MPTGSLCAERNAIGNALVADPTLRREDFRLVAVLSLNKLEQSSSSTTRSRSSSGSSSGGASGGVPSEKASGVVAAVAADRGGGGGGGRSEAAAAPTSPLGVSAAAPMPQLSVAEPPRKRARAASLSEEGSPHPRMSWSQRSATKTHIALSAPSSSLSAASTHSNPLQPCGACCEWLRKITQVCPAFRVVTFLDLSCREVLVKMVS